MENKMHSGMELGGLLGPTWHPNGAKLGAKLGPSWHQNRAQNIIKKMMQTSVEKKDSSNSGRRLWVPKTKKFIVLSSRTGWNGNAMSV